MITKQVNLLKNSLSVIFLLFSLPLSLTAQNSQLSSEMKAPVINAAGQPGNIVMRPSLLGDLKFLFIVAIFSNSSSGIISFNQAQEHANLLANAISINSYNRTSTTIDIAIVTLSNSESFYQNNPLIRLRADAVKAAEQDGFDVDSYDREFIFTKNVWGTGALGTINRRTILMPHNIAYISAHEFGHTNGWRHANFFLVSSGSPISSNGTEIQYGDKYDMMGGSAGSMGPYTPNDYHHFNPWSKYRAGWVPSANILKITNSGTYTIQAIENTPMSAPVTKYTALKIRKDPLTDYWVFFRSQESFVYYGPVITKVFNDNIRPTLLLDMTPGSQNDDWKDAALEVGQTFSDTLAGISVKVLSRSSSELQVDVTVDANAIASMDNLPVIDVTSPLDGVTVKGGIDYEVTAFDPDFGTTNGAGIDKVKLYIHPLNDPVILNLRQGLDPPAPEAITELSAAPYRWYVDSNSLPRDGTYFFIARAISHDGGTQTIWFPHIVDNLGMPATPALYSPSDNSTNVSTDTTLVWSSSSGATSYQVQVSTESDFSTIVVDQSGLSATSFPISALLNSTAYYWRVNATNSTGTTAWSPAWQFSTVAAGNAPAAPALSSPFDNATDVATDTTLVWASSNGATLYQLQVSTVSNFSTIELDKSGLMATSFRLTGLSNRTAYFWRVKASNAGGESPWSTVWQFTTIVAGPAAPLLSSPADDATDIPTTPILVWNTSGGATSYDLQVSTQSNFATLEVNRSALSDTTFQATGLSNSTIQYWRVRAANAGGTSPWSAVWKFTTIIAGPALPVLSAPLDNNTGVPINPVLVWNEAERAITYQLQLSINSNFSTPTVDQSGIADTSLQVTGLLNNVIYFWRVRAANAVGTSDWSSVRHFTTIVATPAAPALSSPADNAINLPVDLALEWNDVSGAVSYQVQVSTQSDFSTGLMGQSGLTLTSFQVSGLADETTYFWRVNATNAGGTSPWSPVWQFTTEPVSSVETGSEIPGDFSLGQNYPNPFNPTTNITFDLPKSEYVSLKVYTLLGTEVATLVSENLPAGKYTIKFDASNLSSGLFFYKLQTNSFVETRKMLLVR